MMMMVHDGYDGETTMLMVMMMKTIRMMMTMAVLMMTMRTIVMEKMMMR